MARLQLFLAHIVVMCCFFFSAPTFAQNNPYSLSIATSYISASRLFPTPDAADPYNQNNSTELGGTVAYSVDFRYSTERNIGIGLLCEYIPQSTEFTEQDGTIITDGYRMYLAELTGYFTLPVSTRQFKLHIGGGIGMYTGVRNLRVGEIESRTTRLHWAFGIHVIIGMEYMITQNVSLVGGLHFRDPQVIMENHFQKSDLGSSNSYHSVDGEPFTSKINVNGNVYRLGVAFHF